MCYDIDNDDNYKQMLKMIEEENYSEFINKVINGLIESHLGRFS